VWSRSVSRIQTLLLVVKVPAAVRFALQLATPRTLVRYRGRFCTTHTTAGTFTQTVTFCDAPKFRHHALDLEC